METKILNRFVIGIFQTSLIIFCCVLFSCKKDKESIDENQIDCTVTVKQNGTNTPVQGASIMLFETDPGSALSVTVNSTPIKTFTTDANGQSKIEFQGKADKSYPVIVTASKYFDSGSSIPLVKKGVSGSSIFFGIYPEAYVKLHIRNTQPFDVYDYVQFGSTCIMSQNEYYFQGNSIDTTFLYRSLDGCDYRWWGNYSFQDGYDITRNSTKQTKQFSFTTIPFDTITVTIDY